MGAVLGVCGLSYAAEALCCAGSAACCACSICANLCSCVRSICGCCCGGGGKEGGGGYGMALGKPMSLLVVFFTIAISLWGQYDWAKELHGLDQWTEDCEGHGSSYRARCMGVALVYRFSFVDVVFFLTLAMLVRVAPQFHHTHWGWKTLYLLALLLCSIFIPNPFFLNGYVWVARIGAATFVVLQQVILIDAAHNVNDYFVSRSNDEGQNGGRMSYDFAAGGALDGHLLALVSLSAFCFASAFVGLVLLFVYFNGCAVNAWLIAITLVLCVAVTATQLFVSRDGNLLASGVVCAYAVFVAYVAVAANPDTTCNPTLSTHDGDALTIALGLVVTTLSLCWTALRASDNVTNLWRHSSAGGAGGGAGGNGLHEVLAGGGSLNKGDDASRLEAALLPDEPSAVAAAPPSAADDDAPLAADGGKPAAVALPPPPVDAGRAAAFCGTMALIALYFGMVLTNWGSLKDGDDGVSSPEAGQVAMWLNIAAQWVMFLLYIWTLIAPVVYPDRDFS